MLACLDVPALPLQLVWRAEPALRRAPVVVIDEDRPAGVVQWACERARAAAILPGMRYAHAQGLERRLHARVVAPDRIAAAIAELRGALDRLSPRVESAHAAGGDPGTFWLDGDGLERLDFGAPWAQAIAAASAQLGFAGVVVAGFSRFATYALARAAGARAEQRTIAMRSAADEHAAAAAVPLARLDLAPKLRTHLARLGVTTLGQLVALPAGGILERYGTEAHRLYQLATGERWDPLTPAAPIEAGDERVVLDDDLTDADQLLFALRPALARLLARLAKRHHALRALHVELTLRHAVGSTFTRTDSLTPAAPTLDAALLEQLIALRLASSPPAAPVNAARLWADAEPATRAQLALFVTRPRRDLAAANAALAKIRAELGDGAVVRAVLREGHLPEASFSYQPLHSLALADPTDITPAERPMIRRIFSPRPWTLPPPAQIAQTFQRSRISGGWWASPKLTPIRRDYHFIELTSGDCLWVYYDLNRARWYCQGSIE